LPNFQKRTPRVISRPFRATGSQLSLREEALIETMRLHSVEEEEKLRALQQEVFELGRKIQKLESEIELLRRKKKGFQQQEDW